MSAITNITVKKANGTTDVVYTATAASAGDTSPAVFRNDTVGTTIAERPTLLVRSTDNGSRTARRVRVDYSWPIVSTDAGGNKVVTGRMSGEASVLIPQNQDAAVIAEQAHQFGNLIGSLLIKQSFSDGFAPR